MLPRAHRRLSLACAGMKSFWEEAKQPAGKMFRAGCAVGGGGMLGFTTLMVIKDKVPPLAAWSLFGLSIAAVCSSLLSIMPRGIDKMEAASIASAKDMRYSP